MVAIAFLGGTAGFLDPLFQPGAGIGDRHQLAGQPVRGIVRGAHGLFRDIGQLLDLGRNLIADRLLRPAIVTAAQAK